MSSTLCHSCSDSSWQGMPSSSCTPTLFTKMSTPPCSAAAASTTCLICWLLVTSTLQNITSPLLHLATSSVSSSPAFASMSMQYTCAPALANARQHPAPIPFAPPVTRTTLPLCDSVACVGSAVDGAGVSFVV